jgi:hypothetical protein
MEYAEVFAFTKWRNERQNIVWLIITRKSIDNVNQLQLHEVLLYTKRIKTNRIDAFVSALVM